MVGQGLHEPMLHPVSCEAAYVRERPGVGSTSTDTIQYKAVVSFLHILF